MSFKEKLALCKNNLIAQGISLFLIFCFFAVDAFTSLYTFFMFFLRFIAFTVILYNVFGIMIKLSRAQRFAVVMRWIMRVGYAVWLASFIIVLGLLLVYAAPDELADTDYIIVLGAGLNGTEPSLILRERLDTAYEAMQKYPDAAVILSGGQGANELIPESLAMYNYLVFLGAKPERLIRESESTDTDDNLRYSSDIIYEREGTRDVKVVIVTCGFHMMRSKLIAEKYGLDPYAATSPTKPREYHYYVREYFSMLMYLLELTGVSIDTSMLNM